MLPAGISSEGSPPRGRGKVCIAFLGLSASRITPAWAGKRYQQQVGRAVGRDHPRVGGEKAKGKPKSQGHLGSPPRGRGKVETISSNSRAEGITPAWAGKSRAAVPAEQLIRDHPRVGGEKYAGRRHRGDLKGSPPRGRGKGQLHPWAAFHAGITPAWAGKRHTLKTSSRDDWDHPRVGGEKHPASSNFFSGSGSPPRGRGKDAIGIHSFLRLGITPAWAGKRLKRSHRSGIFISGPIPFHSVLHRPAGSGGSRAGRDGSPAGQPQNTGPA